MSAVLFVSNGHGEAAIAARIAAELRALAPVRTEHLALVGEHFAFADFPDVGPQRRLPSGGLVAMGNVAAFARDVKAGFFGLWLRQLRWLASARGAYAVVVAVGDAYAAALSRVARTPWIYVGTAKSEYVAPYGPGERRILRGAARVFVRDVRTAEALRARGLSAEAPGNVIVDLLASEERVAWTGAVRLAVLPGSRPRAYADALRIADVVAALRRRVPGVDAVLSIAPQLALAGFEPALVRGGLRPWAGPLGALLHDATLVVGQSGTANEAAAAGGIPVIALELADAPRDAWYRKRQGALLGDALLVVPGESDAAADAIAALLRDAGRRERMGAAGRSRMGPAGGARAIAAAIAAAAG